MKFLDQFLPETISEYREPFVGGGSVFLHARQKYGADVDYWINDKYENLYCFWVTLRDQPDEMIKTLMELKVKNGELNNKKTIKEIIKTGEYNKEQRRAFYKSQTQKGRELFAEAKHRIENSNDFWKGVYLYVLNKCSYSGLTENGTFSPQASIQNFSVTGIRKLRAVSELLQGVKITNLDYANLLVGSSDDTFIFSDPPYKLPSKQSNALYGKNGELHKTFDHARMYHYTATNLGDHMITYNNTEELTNLYRDYNLTEWSLKYGMRIVPNKDGELKAKDHTNNELLITTY
jgi:DNA adenine methylase